MTDKKTLRKKMKEIRAKLDTEALSEILCKKLQAFLEYKNAQNIMIFYPMKDEINLLSLLSDNTKRFYLPKIEGGSLLCCPYCANDELCISSFGTMEPNTSPCLKKKIDLVIVPALACDRNNYRLGYGGGFYDRFLRDYTGIKLVCIPKAQIVDTVHPEKHDIKVDVVLSV